MSLIMKKVKRIIKRILRFLFLDVEIPRVYRRCAKKPVDENKIIFIEVRFPELTDSFKLIYAELKQYDRFDIHEHYLLNVTSSLPEYRKRVISMVKDAATARYIFINDASTAVAALPLREETKLIQVWHACGAFKKFGLSTADLMFGENAKEQKKHPNYRNQSLVTVSSPEVAWAYEEAMGIPSGNGVVQPLGISRTDVFYDETFVSSAKERLYAAFPEARDKKVILYAPTFRGRVKLAATPDRLDIAAFFEAFGGEYVLIFKHHPFVKKLPEIPKAYQAFAYDATKTVTIEDLLCSADICISDYSSLIFEFSLFEKPLLFFAYDLEEYFDWRGFYYDYSELTPGPVVKTNDEMIDYIKQLETNFDRKAVQDFKYKFMRSCDGNSTQRIIKYVLNN